MTIAMPELSGKNHLLAGFYQFFSARRKDGKKWILIKHERDIEFVMKDGTIIVLLGESLCYMPGKFETRKLESEDYGVKMIAKENPHRIYIPGEFFMGKNRNGAVEWVEIPLSDIRLFYSISK